MNYFSKYDYDRPKNKIKFSSRMVCIRLIRATALPLADLSTFQYLPNVLSDILLPLINSTLNIHVPTGFSSTDFGSFDLWETKSSFQIIFNAIIFSIYIFNSLIVLFTIDELGKLLESSAIQHRIGSACFKCYKSLVLKIKRYAKTIGVKVL